jgi:predicted acylesterase/phospholipase RssA
VASSITIVLGGGALYGIGYGMGVLEGLAHRGVGLADCSFLGTSAGSWAAASFACGITFDELADSVEERTLGWTGPARLARDVFGGRRDPRVSAVAVELPWLSGRLLAGHGTDLADLVAASSALPGVFAPHRVGGRWYLDGGVRSPVSIDLAGPADLLIAVVPLAGESLGVPGALVGARARREAASWARRHKGSVEVFHPPPEADRTIKLPHHLFDADRARKAYRIGWGQACASSFARPAG